MFQFGNEIEVRNDEGRLQALFAEIRRRAEAGEGREESRRLAGLKENARCLAWQRLQHASH